MGGGCLLRSGKGWARVTDPPEPELPDESPMYLLPDDSELSLQQTAEYNTIASQFCPVNLLLVWHRNQFPAVSLSYKQDRKKQEYILFTYNLNQLV